MTEFNYLYFNGFDSLEYEEEDIINRKDFDLRYSNITFLFQQYECYLESNNRNKVVELYMVKRNNKGEIIRSLSYYMATGYYAFKGNNRVLLIYIDLTRRGYLGGVDNL